MSRPQPRTARRLDLAAVLVLALAVATFGRAMVGMRELQHVVPAADARDRPRVPALERHAALVRLARAGLALGAAGLALAVAGAVVTARDRRRPPAPPTPTPTPTPAPAS